MPGLRHLPALGSLALLVVSLGGCAGNPPTPEEEIPNRHERPIVEEDGRQTDEEGCLSFPGITFDVERSLRVTVEADDLDGERRRYTFEGLMARAVLHECEHLDGKTFLRNLSPLKRELIKKQIRKKIKAGDWIEMAES